jgi:hypothetical protein
MRAIRRIILSSGYLACLGVLAAQSGPVIRTGYRLTAHKWKPAAVTREGYLEAIEGVCRFSIAHQNAAGAIIDPYLKREHQYATPYFAHAVGTLVSAGRARDLLPNGVRAMEHSTSNFGDGRAAIPDTHGEFFIAALTEALELYRKHVPAAQFAEWRRRMAKPRAEVIRGAVNNWETYPMKGDWLRALAGLADRAEVVKYIESAWAARQRGRFSPAPWFVYHDRSSDPDTLNVEAVGRGNILALVEAGYDGPSAEEMRHLVENATRTALDLQDPTGQSPTNGRTDDHVWVDVGYGLAFEVMAHRTKDAWLAGQYRRAATLSFQNIHRWRRADGSFSVTKNHFDPALRVGYQEASQYSNYNGSLMFHLAETYHLRRREIAERPTPSEIGGYAIEMDPQFAVAFANAGGMQVEASLRGQLAKSNGNWWTPLGIVRFARAGWDTRLGPSDGALTDTGGVTFAPEFREDGRWYRMADLSARYEGVWSVEFVHPLLVRCAVEYRPKAGQRGPTFRDELIVTPDGVLSTVRKTSSEAVEWGVTWPLLENDGGGPLTIGRGDGWRTTQFPGATDQESFLAAGPVTIEDGPALRSTYGDLRAVRVRSDGDAVRTFVYPRSAGDPTAEEVRKTLVITPDGFRSAVGRVAGTLYMGRQSAGGVGKGADLDVSFDEACGFLLQVRSGRVTAVETDRAVTGRVQGRAVRLQAHAPQTIR